MKLIMPVCLLAISILSGCYTTSSYTGIYFLERAKSSQLVSFEDLALKVFEVLKPFGFKRVQLPREIDDRGAIFSHQVQHSSQHLIGLSGSGARISVSVNYNSNSITIRDMDNDIETQFVRAIKKAIERNISQYYDLKGLIFEQQADVLA